MEEPIYKAISWLVEYLKINNNIKLYIIMYYSIGPNWH